MDRDYRGNVGVVLFNHSQAEFKIAKGDRVAQLICERILYPELIEVEVSKHICKPQVHLLHYTQNLLFAVSDFE